MTLRQRAERHTISIRKGDNVKVIAGKMPARPGACFDPREEHHRVVEHVGIIKRHTRPNPSKNIKGGIVEKEAGINVSNVMVVCGAAASIPGLATRFCRTDRKFQLPPLQHGAGQVKDKVEEGDEESIAGKIPGETVPALMKRFGWKNMMAVPKLKKSPSTSGSAKPARTPSCWIPRQ